MELRLGSLFSGAGWLDRGIEAAFAALGVKVRTVWVSDIDPGPVKVLAHRFPDAPNLGDITAIDWPTVEPVDIIAGGSPCQDISSAGRMAGMREGTRSNLWVEMREAIATLQPMFVSWENVYAARSTAASSAMESDPRLLGDHPPGKPALRVLGRVLGDLADRGYDTEWICLPASGVGAPHRRLRYFLIAANTRGQAWLKRAGLCAAGPGGVWGRRLDHGGGEAHPLAPFGIAVQMLPTPSVADAMGTATEQAWGPYAPAIARWEAIVGPAPAPTKPGKKGRPKLNPEFACWMMGSPPGRVTEVPGITDNEALKIAGNGVVQQQAAHALQTMLGRWIDSLEEP